MKKMILMHREDGGLVQPISTHRRRGSAVIYMLMVLVKAMRAGPGQGGHAVLLVDEVFEGLQLHTYNHSVWKTICWSSSGPASRSIYTLLNQTCLLDAPPPPLILLLWDTYTHIHCHASFQTQISLSYFRLLSWWGCAPGFGHN